MIADFRKKPSLARQKAAREQRLAARAEANRILSERLHEKFGGPFVPVAAIDPGVPNARIAAAYFNPRTGEMSHYVWGS